MHNVLCTWCRHQLEYELSFCIQLCCMCAWMQRIICECSIYMWYVYVCAAYILVCLCVYMYMNAWEATSFVVVRFWLVDVKISNFPTNKIETPTWRSWEKRRKRKHVDGVRLHIALNYLYIFKKMKNWKLKRYHSWKIYLFFVLYFLLLLVDWHRDSVKWLNSWSF